MPSRFNTFKNTFWKYQVDKQYKLLLLKESSYMAEFSPSLRGGEKLGEIPHCSESGLFPLSCLKNIDFVIFMQFLAILPKMFRPY